MALTDDILTALDSGPIADIAQQLDLGTDQVQAVVKDALPAILGGMAQNSQTDEGATSLANALGDHANANPLGDLGSLLGGDLGGSILKHVLGGSTPDVAGAISEKAGVDSATVQKILAIVAPIVMAYLGKKVLGGGGSADAGTVKDQVQAESKDAASKASTPDLGSILGSILGR